MIGVNDKYGVLLICALTELLDIAEVDLLDDILDDSEFISEFDIFDE